MIPNILCFITLQKIGGRGWGSPRFRRENGHLNGIWPWGYCALLRGNYMQIETTIICGAASFVNLCALDQRGLSRRFTMERAEVVVIPSLRSETWGKRHLWDGWMVWPGSDWWVLWYPTHPQTARMDGARGFCGIGSDEKQTQVLRLRSLRRPSLRMTAFVG